MFASPANVLKLLFIVSYRIIYTLDMHLMPIMFTHSHHFHFYIFRNITKHTLKVVYVEDFDGKESCSISPLFVVRWWLELCQRVENALKEKSNAAVIYYLFMYYVLLGCG